MILKRIDPVSAGKIYGIVCAVLGLIFGAIVALLALVGGGMFGSHWGMGAIVIFPIMYGVLGFLTTFIGALIYNAAAGAVGGVRLDLE